MNYGLYTAASGMLVNMYRMDVVGNNLANVNTIGFKPDYAAFHWREPERVESGLAGIAPKRMLERLGGGVGLSRNITHFQDGSLEETHNPLDVAVQGEGFFKFATGRGIGYERMRFGRDGRFTISADGYLVHSGSGMRVLDQGDNPIQLRPTGHVIIQPDGTVEQGGERLARIGLVIPSDVRQLKKDGDNMFTLNNSAQESLLPANVNLKAGWLEQSAVDEMNMMLELTAASEAVSANARMIQMNDELMNSAINRLARVA